MDFDDFKTVFGYLWPFLKAVLIFVIGHYIVKGIVSVTKRAVRKSKLDKSLVNILMKTLSVIGNILVVLSALNAMNIPITGLLAVASAIAVGLGLALKDSLGSVAGGIILLAQPRFVTGDYISIDGEEGFVDEIHLMHTTIRAYDNRHITYSNGEIINSKIINYTWEGKHRIDMVFPIPYGSDTELAKRLASEVVGAHDKILPPEEGERIIRVGEYAESAVKLHVFVWCKREDYITIYYDLTEQIRAKFLENGIEIPFNQLDVHIDNLKK